MFRRKLLASLLSFVLLTAFMPIGSFALETDDASDVPEEGQVETVIGGPEEQAYENDEEDATEQEITNSVTGPLKSSIKQAGQEEASVSITGSNELDKYSSIQLTASISPKGADGTVQWSSSDPKVLTVDDRGLVAGVREGTASVCAVVDLGSGKTVSSEPYPIKVKAAQATGDAQFFYLKTPKNSAASNDTKEWCDKTIGNGTINDVGAWTGTAQKNFFISNDSGRVLSWPSGFENGVVPATSPEWNKIYNAYKEEVAKTVGHDISEENIVKIELVPFKISRNNGNDKPNKHVDCTVRITTTEIYTVTYNLWDEESAAYISEQVDYKKAGQTTRPEGLLADLEDEITTADNKEYKLWAWYDNSGLDGSAVLFNEPYPVNKNEDFYARYIEKNKYPVRYELAGGTWSRSTAPDFYYENKQVSATYEEPSKEGFEFSGWRIEGVKGQTAIKGGGIFKMPSREVVITATYTKIPDSAVQTQPNSPVAGGGNAGGAAVAAGGAVVAAAPIQAYTLTEIPNEEKPLANNILDDNCCILHLIIMLLALIALWWYTSDMRKQQKKIFELEKQLEDLDE